MKKNTFRFPAFLDLAGQKITVIGGGKVAIRRVKTLIQFQAAITVISPVVTSNLQLAAEHGKIIVRQRPYQPGDLAGSFLAVAATDSPEVNRLAAEEARQNGILISVADNPQQSSFYFPAVAEGGGVIAGIVSDGTNHHLVRRRAQQIREFLNERKRND